MNGQYRGCCLGQPFSDKNIDIIIVCTHDHELLTVLTRTYQQLFIREPTRTLTHLRSTPRGGARGTGKARAMGLETLFTEGSSTEPPETDVSLLKGGGLLS